MIDTILVDMDGVLCNFLDPVLELWQFPRDKYPTETWDIAGVLGITEFEMWARIEAKKDFWPSLKPFPWFSQMIDMLEATDLPWYIASSPCADPLCCSHKVSWIRKHLDQPTFDRIMLGHAKHLMANDRTVLIDDSDSNIKKFNFCGGRASLFPQQWNTRHLETDPFSVVKRELEALLRR